MLDVTNRARGVVPASSVVLIILALGGALVSESPFNSARPSHNYPAKPIQENVLEIQQWEDPFFYDEPVEAQSGDSDTAPLNDLRKAIRAKAEQGNAKGDTTLLINMVPSGKRQWSVETRRGERVALSHALVGEGYRPATPGKIKFISPPGFTISSDGAGSECFLTAPDNTLTIAYEWYVQRRTGDADSERNILVLWLRDDKLDDPRLMLENVINNLLVDKSTRDNVSIRVVGPSSSGGLKKIYNETSQALKDTKRMASGITMSRLEHWLQFDSRVACKKDKIAGQNSGNPEGDEQPSTSSQAALLSESEVADSTVSTILANIRNTEKRDWLDLAKVPIISHKATVENSILFDTDKDKGSDGKDPRPNLYRIIASDSELSRVLIDELSHRSINLCHQKTKLLLILEADNIYGIRYRNAIQGALEQHCKKEGYSRHASLLVTNYFSIVDGEHTEERGEASAGDDNSDLIRKIAMGDPSVLDSARVRKIENPSGPHQLDYIRRMAKRLAEVHKHDVSAIGIVGTDVYDKQLIIQAIRTYLDQPLIFTTDVHALYEKPEFYRYNQNLLVASGEGLESAKHDEKQKLARCDFRSEPTVQTTPVNYQPLWFRDNYQSSTYKAVLTSLCSDEQLKNLKSVNQQGRVFEIGRNGLYEISSSSEDSRSPFGFRLVFLLSPLLLLQLYLFSKRKGFPINSQVADHLKVRNTIDGLLLANFVAIGAIAILLWYLDCHPDKYEPVVIFEGISAMPTFVFRLSAFLIAISLFVYAYSVLKLNTKHLARYFIEGSDRIENRTLDYEMHSETESHDRSAGNAENSSDKTLAGRLWAWVPQTFATITAIGRWESIIYGNLSRSVRAPDKASWKPTTAESIWKTYRKLANWRPIIIRVLPLYVSVLIVTAYLTFFYYGQPKLMRHIPFGIDSAITIISLYGTLFMIFIAGNGLRLCTAFVRQHQFDYVSWSKIPHRSKYKHLTPYAASRLASLEVISRRTEAMSSIIVFPFLVLFLMVMARSNIFDGWTWNPGVIGTFSFVTIYLLYQSARLQQAANNTRKRVFNDLHRERNKIAMGVRQFETDQDKQEALDSLDSVIKYIAELKTGLFSPVLSHPLFQAVAWPSTAVGIITLTQLLL